MERDLSPREKVSKARRFFRIILKELLTDTEARGTTRIDHDVRMILKRQHICVNSEYMIGEVPGILVGYKFEYKSELNMIDLNFGMMSDTYYT